MSKDFISLYTKFRKEYNFKKNFDKEMKEAEESLLAKIFKEKENRKNLILLDIKPDFDALEDDNDDQAIKNFARKKLIEQKLFVTCRFW